MFVKLGDSFIISLVVEDVNGNRVSDDNPTVVFYNTVTKQYWNGLAWQSARFVMYMEYQDNGVYMTSFTPDRVGSFTAAASSSVYTAAQTLKVDVYDESIAKYDWQTGLAFTASHTRTNGLPTTTPPTIIVNRVFDNTFLDGDAAWSNAPIALNMVHIGANVFTFTFIPDVSSEYMLTIADGSDDSLFAINASVAGSDVLPIIVSSDTLLNNDSSNTAVVSNSGLPLQGATVKLYNLVTKELVASATTDVTGSWSVLVRPGRYYFMFEKDSYEAVGFERTVS